jgi:dihydrofolate reductase
MRKLILVAHTSLDGFIAGEKGELSGFEPGQENLEFVCKLTEQADAALFGRISYQLLNEYWPSAKDRPNVTKGEIDYSNWYNRAEKIVVSRTLSSTNPDRTTIIRDNVLNEVKKIKSQPGKDIFIFGSASVTQLLIPLIDEYWIFINPVIFGKGIPLFVNGKDKINLQLTESKQFSNGELALKYLLVCSLS